MRGWHAVASTTSSLPGWGKQRPLGTVDESDSIGGLPASSQSQEAGLQPGPGAPGSRPGWPLAQPASETGSFVVDTRLARSVSPGPVLEGNPHQDRRAPKPQVAGGDPPPWPLPSLFDRGPLRRARWHQNVHGGEGSQEVTTPSDEVVHFHLICPISVLLSWGPGAPGISATPGRAGHGGQPRPCA